MCHQNVCVFQEPPSHTACYGQNCVSPNSVSEAQFTEAVYRNYHGETITQFAKDFGVGQSTLSQLKSRRSEDWERIKQEIRTTEIIRLVFENEPNTIPHHNTTE